MTKKLIQLEDLRRWKDNSLEIANQMGLLNKTPLNEFKKNISLEVAPGNSRPYFFGGNNYDR